MIEAAVFMAVMLAATLLFWRVVTPSLADRRQEQPVEIRTREDHPRRK